MEEDISGLQISMQNVFVVESLKGIFKLGKDLDGFRLVKPLLSFDVLGKCSSVAELVDQVIVIGCTQHFHELDDVNVADFA